jgi:hypothetical protein
VVPGPAPVAKSLVHSIPKATREDAKVGQEASEASLSAIDKSCNPIDHSVNIISDPIETPFEYGRSSAGIYNQTMLLDPLRDSLTSNPLQQLMMLSADKMQPIRVKNMPMGGQNFYEEIRDGANSGLLNRELAEVANPDLVDPYDIMAPEQPQTDDPQLVAPDDQLGPAIRRLKPSFE